MSADALFNQEQQLREHNRKLLLQQVARCVREGLTDHGAAERLGVSGEKVKAARKELGLPANKRGAE